MTMIVDGTNGLTFPNSTTQTTAFSNVSPTFTGTLTAENINASGNVGIGTSSPAVKLDVAGNATVQNGVLTVGKDTIYDAFINTPESMYFNVDSDGNSTGNKFVWGTDRASNTGGTTWMTLDASGNLLVGSTTNADSARFKVYGGITYDSVNATWQNFYSGGTQFGTFGQGNYAVSGAPANFFGMSGNNGLVFGVGASNTERMRITTAGDVGVGTSNPALGFVVEKDNGSGYVAGFRSASGSPILTIQNTGGISQIQGLNSALSATANIALQVSGGNVGVGTSSPTTKLDVVGSGDGEVRIRATSDAALIFSETTANKNWKLKPSAGDLYWQYSATAYNSGYSSLMALTTSGNLQFNSGYGSVATAYGTRAWVCFNGTGTPAIRASGNTSSITDNGTGDYTINFTSAMPDTNFGTAGMCCNDVVGGTSQTVVSEKDTGVRTTSSVRIYAGIGTTRYDFPYVSVAISR